MTQQTTYQNLQDWYKNQEKEVKYAVGIAITIAISIFAMAIDSLVNAGVLGFISGTLIICAIGILCALAFLVVYWIAAVIAPKKTEKIFNALTKEPEEDDELD